LPGIQHVPGVPQGGCIIAHRNGWFLDRWDDIIHLGDVWEVQIDLHGAAWGIPQELITRFKNQLTAAKALLAEVKSVGRNSVNTEQCRLAFRDLELTMQFFKANYFNSPPRTADEVIALLLSLHFSTSRKWYELPFSLADLRLEVYVTACWQTPRFQDGPYCPIVSRIIA
jgi:hypothetical protein